MIPVILFFYSPAQNQGAWVPIKDFIKHQEYHGITPIKKIVTKLDHRELTHESFSNLRDYAKLSYDSKQLFECVEKCLSEDSNEVFDNFMILVNHPYSRDKRITLLLAKDLLNSDNDELLKTALWIFGYGVGRRRWSFNPNNKEEQKVIKYACNICSNLTEVQIYKLLCLIDNESFHGPEALGERYFDIISCCADIAFSILEKVAADKSEPFQRRKNALYLLYECNIEYLEEDYKNKNYSDEYTDLFGSIFHKQPDCSII